MNDAQGGHMGVYQTSRRVDVVISLIVDDCVNAPFVTGEAQGKVMRE
jgi:hypothetical protein